MQCSPQEGKGLALPTSSLLSLPDHLAPRSSGTPHSSFSEERSKEALVLMGPIRGKGKTRVRARRKHVGKKNKTNPNDPTYSKARGAAQAYNPGLAA